MKGTGSGASRQHKSTSRFLPRCPRRRGALAFFIAPPVTHQPSAEWIIVPRLLGHSLLACIDELLGAKLDADVVRVNHNAFVVHPLPHFTESVGFSDS